MAQGQFLFFNKFLENMSDSNNLTGISLVQDSFKLKLTDDTLLPVVTNATPDEDDYTEVAPIGTSYTAGGAAATVSWVEATGTVTLALDTDISWVQDGSGPTNIHWGILYSTTHTGTTENAVGFIELRTGGTTAISLQDGAITITAGTMATAARP